MQNTTRFIRKYFEPRFEEWVCAHLTDHFNNENNTVDDSRIKNIFQESKHWKDLVSECERHQSNYNENLEPYDVQMPKDRAFRDARIKIYEKHNITTQGVGRRSEN